MNKKRISKKRQDELFNAAANYAYCHLREEFYSELEDFYKNNSEFSEYIKNDYEILTDCPFELIDAFLNWKGK